MIRHIEKLILLALCLVFSVSTYAQDKTNIIDEIIWIVGDEAILKSDVEHVRMDMQASGQRMKGDPYCFIPEQLAMQKLFLDQAKIDSIVVGDADINRSISTHEKNVINNIGSKEKVEEYLKAPMTEIRDRWREDARNNFMIEQAQHAIMKKTKALTPSDVRKFYAQLPQDSLPYIPTTVEVQIITTKPTIPLEEIDKIKERLRDFRNRILEGKASFSTLAIMYSEDQGSAANGGELGFTGRAALLPEFSNVAFALSDTEKVSNIVETEYGYHIIQLIERRGDRANFRHILLQPHVPDKEFDVATTVLDSLTADIHRERFSFEEAAQISADKDTRKNGGLMINQNYRSGYGMSPRFAMEDLPAEIAQTVDTMKVNNISKPFIMKQPSGQEIVAIVKLKNRVEGHLANVSDDYQTLKEIVEEKKQEEELALWLKKKINDTYVKINDRWRKCEFQYTGWIKDND